MREIVTTVLELAAVAAIVAGVVILWGVGWGLLVAGALVLGYRVWAVRR